MRKQLNILIVEDEILIAEMLKEMLLELKYNISSMAKSYETAFVALKKNAEINFAILDINLTGEKSGIEIAARLNTEYKIPFIFLTSYSDTQTLSRAMAVKPEAYLIKPFTIDDIYTTVEIVRARKTTDYETIIIHDRYLKIKLFIKDIFWVESDGNYLKIVTKEKRYLVRDSFDDFLKNIRSSNFIRVHRSFVVNIEKVDAVNGQYLLIDKEKIPFSRKFKNKVMDSFLK